MNSYIRMNRLASTCGPNTFYSYIRRLLYLAVIFVFIFAPRSAYSMGNPPPNWYYEPQLPQRVGNAFRLDRNGVLASGASVFSFFNTVNLYVSIKPYESAIVSTPGTMVFHSSTNPELVRIPYSYRYTLMDQGARVEKSVSIVAHGRSGLNLEDLNDEHLRVSSSNTMMSHENALETLREPVTVPPGATLSIVYSFSGFPDDKKDFWIDLQDLGIPVQIQFKAYRQMME
jgi:hypothetical protein